MIKISTAILLVLLVVILMPVTALAQMSQGQQVIVKETAQVNEVGDVHLEMIYTYPANYYTLAVAPSKVNPFLISEIRYLRSGESPKEIPKDSIKVEFNDANSSVKVTCDAMGFTRNMGDYWELETSEGATVTGQTNTSIILTSTEQDAGNTYLYTSIINFPEGTKDIKFNADNGKVRYTLPYKSAGGFSPIWWVVIAVVVCAVLAGVFFVIRKKSVA